MEVDGAAGEASAASQAPKLEFYKQPEWSLRLTESALYKEDVLLQDHTSVWGSWYDPTQKKWGYICCKSTVKTVCCSAAVAAKAAAQAAKEAARQEALEKGEVPPRSPSHPSDSSTDEETRRARVDEERPLNWSDPPLELLPVAQVEGGQPAAYIQHFIRYVLGQWQIRLEKNGLQGFTEIEKAAFKDSLAEAQSAVTPLMCRLRNGTNLNRGEERYKSKSRETRTSMEGKFVKEQDVLHSIMTIATAGYEMDYQKAHATYMRLTFGNKMWNLTHVAHVAACTMKGAREYRRNRDSLNTYDMDPVSQRYMHAMKKIMHFCQCIRPNPDQSKNFVM